jgi:hypothetical protein
MGAKPQGRLSGGEYRGGESSSVSGSDRKGERCVRQVVNQKEDIRSRQYYYAYEEQ